MSVNVSYLVLKLALLVHFGFCKSECVLHRTAYDLAGLDKSFTWFPLALGCIHM